MRKVSERTPQFSVLATLPPRPSITPVIWVVNSSSCWALASWRARKTCSYRGMGVLSSVSAGPGGKPFETFGKDLDIAQKAEARDDGQTGPVTSIERRLMKPSVQLPAGTHGCALYRRLAAVGKGLAGRFDPYLARKSSCFRQVWQAIL